MLLKEAKEILSKNGYKLNESANGMDRGEKFVLLYSILKYVNGVKVLTTMKDAYDNASISFKDEEDEITYYIGDGYFGGPGGDVSGDSVIVASYYDENDGEEPDDEEERDINELISNYAERAF